MNESPPLVWVFFYGTIMDPAVMKDFGVTAGEVEPAQLAGFELSIRPRPNIAPAQRSTVFGSLMTVTHQDLTTIYSGLEKHFGIKYLPEAIFAANRAGALRPALCYRVAHMPDSPADTKFVIQLAQCVRTMGHPDWYAEYVESFAVASGSAR
jgi:hypothetical protein